MKEISMNRFLDGVDEIAVEKPEYQLGHDGSDGECDCIGLIIGAIRRSGGEWSGIHGSNYAARNEMDYLLPVTDAGELNVGEIVYKTAMPGQTNYALPSRYAKDPDQRDYYHVGVVRSVDPLQLVHCTSPGGIAADTRLGKWTYRGWLKKVSQEGGTTMQDVTMATVVADSGSSVKMRATPSTDERRWWGVPVGTEVPVAARENGWSRIAFGGHSGWMMDKHLFIAGDTSGAGAEAGDTVSITLPRELAEQLRDTLSDAVGWG